MRLINLPEEYSEFEINFADPVPIASGNEHYWKVELRFRSGSNIRLDMTNCARPILDGGPFAFTAAPDLVVENCTPAVLTSTVRHTPTVIPEQLTIGGFTLRPNRDNWRVAAGGLISGTGSVETPTDTWAVQFNNLHINADNQVIEGHATVQTRTDLPPWLDTIVQGAAMTSADVNRFTQLWYSDAVSLLNMLAGEKKVPIGLEIGPEDFGEQGDVALKFAIVKMRFETFGAFFDLMAGVRIPMATHGGPSTQWLGLYAENVPFCQSRSARYRTALRYLQDTVFGSPDFTGWEFTIIHSAPSSGLLPIDYMMQPGDGTGIVLSERGFEQLHIEFQVQFPRNVFIPVQQVNNRWQDIPGTRTSVTAVFDYKRTEPQRGGGFYMVTQNFPASRIHGTNFKILAINQMVFDWSRAWSPQPGAGPGPLLLPPNVPNPIPGGGAAPTLPPEWIGPYISQAAIDFPPLNTPIGIQNLYFGSPINFTAYATPMAETRLGDAMTVRLDTIDVVVRHGNFERARIATSMTFPGAIEGRIGLQLVYQQIPEGEETQETDAFFINLRADEETRIKITDYLNFGIHRGSQMTVAYVEHPPEGQQHWNMAFDISGDLALTRQRPNVQIKAIEFENLEFAGDGKGVQSPRRITSFGRTIYERETTTPGSGETGGETGREGEAGGEEGQDREQKVAGFPIGIENFEFTFGSSGTSLGIAAELTIALTGETEGPHFGGAVGLALDGIFDPVNQKWQAPELRLTSLEVNYDSDPLTIHGEVEFLENGFSGRVEVAMAKMFNGQAEIEFGRQENYRYWYVKGGITLSEAAGIPIVPGVINAYGFIGGAYSHMEAQEERNADGVVTGVRFQPTAARTFGILAGVHIGIANKPSSFHAKVVLSAQFRDARLQNIRLNGRGWFMCELTKECNDPTKDSWAAVDITMDFDRPLFHASAEATINLRPLLFLSAPPGSVDILFEPGNWHIYVGQSPLGGGRTIRGEFIPDIARIRAEVYFQVGHNIEVKIGSISLRGGGFATGVGVEFDTGEKTFFIFYGRVYGHFIAELALIKVDESLAECIRGANGWYALAHLDILLGLDAGIKINMWFIRGKFSIFQAELGIAVFVGGPNPTFFDGDARGSFRILNGLVRGRFHLHVHIGPDLAECLQYIMDQFTMPDPITEIKPDGTESEPVSVFTSIGLGFAVPEGQVFEVPTEEGDIRYLRWLLQPLEVISEGGASVAGAITVDTERLSAEWITDSVFVGRTQYTVRATAVVQELRGGSWRDTSKRQTKEVHFTTGDRPRDIYDPRARSFQYPLDRQRFSYTNGHEGKHYVHMTKDMSYLFTNLPSSQTLVAQYVGENNQTLEVPFRFEGTAGLGSFVVIDNINLPANTRYHLRLIKRTVLPRVTFPVWSATVRWWTLQNLTSRERGITVSTDGYRTTLTSGSGETVIEQQRGSAQSRVVWRDTHVDTMLFDWFFRTGRYANITGKFASARYVQSLMWSSIGGVKFEFGEPIDDDFTSFIYVRDPGVFTTFGPAREWVNFIGDNERLARIYSYLASRVGEDDALRLFSHVLTSSGTSVSNGNATYVDALANFNFRADNYNRYRMNDLELWFEVLGMSIEQLFELWIGAPLPAAPVHSEWVAIDALNAYHDFNAMKWRYQNALSMHLSGRLPLLSPNTVTFLQSVSNRTWQNLPDENHTLALVQLSRNMRLSNWRDGRTMPYHHIRLREGFSKLGSSYDPGGYFHSFMRYLPFPATSVIQIPIFHLWW
jgi:hypothetical protein